MNTKGIESIIILELLLYYRYHEEADDGGNDTKTISGKTNAQGFYELELSNVPTSITFKIRSFNTAYLSVI